jgi:hypothetical protein
MIGTVPPEPLLLEGMSLATHYQPPQMKANLRLYKQIIPDVV